MPALTSAIAHSKMPTFYKTPTETAAITYVYYVYIISQKKTYANYFQVVYTYTVKSCYNRFKEVGKLVCYIQGPINPE